LHVGTKSNPPHRPESNRERGYLSVPKADPGERALKRTAKGTASHTSREREKSNVVQKTKYHKRRIHSEQPAFNVIEDAGSWYVVDGHGRISNAMTNAEAWQWIDKHSAEGLKAIETFNRIRAAFSGE
jgi:hypothetical protein